MKRSALCLMVLLTAAACSAESPKTPAPAPTAKPAESPAPKPAEAPAAKPAEEPAAAPATAPAAAPTKLEKTTPSANYPLKTCVVSGEDLGAMGERIAYTYEGTEVQFCCADCIDEFRKDPQTYLAKVRAAKK